MKKYLLLSVLLATTISLFSCRINLDNNNSDNDSAFSEKKEDGNLLKKEFEISDYHKIKQTGVVDIVYEQKETEEPYLRVEIDSNLMSLVAVNVDGGELSVGLEERVKLKPTRFVVYTNSKQLSAVSLSGVGRFSADEKVKSDNLNISLSGTGSVKFKDLEAGRVGARLSGTGSLKLAGIANDSEFKVSGIGSIKAEDLVVKNADCRVSGVGSIYIQATDNLEAKVSGAGSVKYKGKAKSITQSSSGVGRVRKM